MASIEGPLSTFGFAATSFGFVFAAGWRTVLAAVLALGDDIDFVAILQHLAFSKLHLAIRYALASLHVVFQPWAKTKCISVSEKWLRGFVRRNRSSTLARQAFAGRAALMQAEITVGVELALVAEYTDLLLANKHDPAIAILEFGDFGDKFFSHGMPFVDDRGRQLAPLGGL